MIQNRLIDTLRRRLPHTGDTSIAYVRLKTDDSDSEWICSSIDPNAEVIHGAYRVNSHTEWKCCEFSIENLKHFIFSIVIDPCFTPRHMRDVLGGQDIYYSFVAHWSNNNA